MVSYEFVNPYNFIPLKSQEPERIDKDQIRGTYTGKIKYRLLTKTPLFIPNTSRDDAFSESKDTTDHKSYDFFSYQDLSEIDSTLENKYFEPVIPGSEIRGMLRANYEILTNSCMSAMDDEVVLSKRTQEKFQAGLIKRISGEAGVSYELYGADDCLMRTKGENNLQDDRNWKDDPEHNGRKCYKQKALREGQKVLFELCRRDGKGVKPLALNVTRGRDVGYVLKGEAGPEQVKNGGYIKQNKHCCHVFHRKGNAIRNLNTVELKAFEQVLKCYKANDKNAYQEYAKEWNVFQKGNGEEMFPVYYSFEDPKKEYILLSPACITREIYQTKLSQMIGKHRSCGTDGKKTLCPACALFGMLGRGFQNTSRIRVADLRLSEKDAKMFGENPSEIYMKKVTCKPLGSPKISNMEFYVKRPQNAWFWTYDYYITEDGVLQSYMPEINGRKFYWHQMNPILPQNIEPSNLNSTIRPVKKDVFFEGEIYFDDLTKEELDQLIYVINAGDDGDIAKKTHGYKMGHAKPLGLGSVALSVDQVLLRKLLVDDERRSIERCELLYAGENQKDQCYERTGEVWAEPEFDPKIKSDFRIMTDFHYLEGKTIDYPRKMPDRDIFAWFTENHSGYREDKKKNNQRVKASMPADRKHMVYVNYLEAMNPILKETGVADKVLGFEKSGQGQDWQYNGTRAEQPTARQDGKKQSGKITYYNAERGYGFARLDDGRDVYFKSFAIKNLDDLPDRNVKKDMILEEVETIAGDGNGKDRVKHCRIKAGS